MSQKKLYVFHVFYNEIIIDQKRNNIIKMLDMQMKIFFL